MFKIYDGREKFYQWDLDRKLIVEDASVTEVHFCNRTDSCSLVCETYVEDGVTLVNVPNVLLTTDWKIHVYAYDGKHTKHETCYEVVSRTKPSDYIYTETEVKRYEDYENRIKATEDTLVEVDAAFKEVAEVIGSIDEELGGLRTDIDTLEKTVEDIGNADLSGKPGKFYTATGEIYNDYEHNVASGEYSHAEGYQTTAHGANSHVEGEGATASFLTGLTLEIGNVEKDNKGIEKTLTTTTLTVPNSLISLDDIADSYSYGCLIEINHNTTIPIDKIEIIDKSSLLGFESGKIKATLFNDQVRNITPGQEITNVYLGVASGESSHAEGFRNTAAGDYSHAEGEVSIAVGEGSHAEGHNTKAIGEASHAEGEKTRAEGHASHAEGQGATADGDNSHAEGNGTIASGENSHAEGYKTIAKGKNSHAEGHTTNANGKFSHTEGEGTTAEGYAQHVSGKYNISDKESLVIVGNGKITKKDAEGNAIEFLYSNAYTLDKDGNGWYAGSVEGTALILKSPSGKRFKITVSDSGALSTTAI